MHIHANQINLNAQLDASYTTEKVAAKREAEGFRRTCWSLYQNWRADLILGRASSAEIMIVLLVYFCCPNLASKSALVIVAPSRLIHFPFSRS